MTGQAESLAALALAFLLLAAALALSFLHLTATLALSFLLLAAAFSLGFLLLAAALALAALAFLSARELHVTTIALGGIERIVGRIGQIYGRQARDKGGTDNGGDGLDTVLRGHGRLHKCHFGWK